MNLLLVLTAFMASLSGMLAGGRDGARTQSVAASMMAEAGRVAPVEVATTARPAAARPRLVRATSGMTVAAVPADLFAMLGRRRV